MDALEVLKTVVAELRRMQFDPLQRSHGEADAGYRNGHNDGVRAAVRVVEAHIGVSFACGRGCGWNARSAAGEDVTRLMRRYGRCPGNGTPCGAHVEMAEVAL